MIININKFASEVRAWNYIRDNKEFDEGLEIDMLVEEYREYLESYSLVNRVDALCDFVFVYLGTVAKMSYDTSFNSLSDFVKRNKLLKDYVDICINQMLEEISAEYFLSDDELEIIFNVAMSHVIAANNKKGIQKNAAGKIQKGADWTDPKKDIALLLAQRGLI